MVSETRPMVLAKGHNARWPLTSLHCWRSWMHSRPRRSTTASARPPRRSTRRSSRPSSPAWSAPRPMNVPTPGLPSATDTAHGVLTTTVGDLELCIPKLRRIVLPLAAGTAPPGRPGPVRGGHGGVSARVSTRKVDDLVRALGVDSGISRSEASRICVDLDHEVGAFRDRSLAGRSFPYVFVDATYCKARVNRRVVSQAVVVATGVCGDGRREVLGFAVGDSEDGAFWTAFLRSLKARGLAGVQLVIADAHLGLRQRMSRPPWNLGGGPGADQAAASSLLGVTVAMVASRAARRAGRCRWPLMRRNCLAPRPSRRRSSAAPSGRPASA
jgi:hypothetical protein